MRILGLGFEDHPDEYGRRVYSARGVMRGDKDGHLQE